MYLIVPLTMQILALYFVIDQVRKALEISETDSEDDINILKLTRLSDQ